MLYSKLTDEIVRLINGSQEFPVALGSLISRSYELALHRGTPTSVRLHNKLLKVLHNKFSCDESAKLVEEFVLLPKEVESLIGKFNIDPSNMQIVYELGVAYVEFGKLMRGGQLLRRVASSGYKESQLARDFLKSHEDIGSLYG